MTSATTPVAHANSFNLLRLVFAVLVIVSHTPELIDGNRSREILSVVFGTYSFGDLAVNSFFILSGYLITASWLVEPHLATFVRKRVARILPGFVVAVLVSVLLFGPAGSPTFWADFDPLQVLRRIPFLLFDVRGFPESKYPLVNGALWTIHYEFACYLLVAGLGLLGALQRPRLIIGLAAGMLALYVAAIAIDPFMRTGSAMFSTRWIRAFNYIRLVSMFLVGSVLFFTRSSLKPSGGLMLTLAAAVVLLMFNPRTAAIAMAPWAVLLYLLGSRNSWLASKIGATDLSYGIYLYAWPVQQLVIQRLTTDPLLAGISTLAGSVALAGVSWQFVERPALAFKRARSQAGAQLARVRT